MSQQPDATDDPRPVLPVEPEAGACCQNGCDPCIYDRYWDAMNCYEQALAEWEGRRLAGSVAAEGVLVKDN